MTIHPSDGLAEWNRICREEGYGIPKARDESALDVLIRNVTATMRAYKRAEELERNQNEQA
jgi:hypothetical protein